MSRIMTTDMAGSEVRYANSKCQQIEDDPFRRLPTEVVGLLIAKLDNHDTERLRRVCKSWKALSEFFNGLQAIARRCPMLLPLAKLQPQHANLCFRRWLCTEKSLAAGHAHDVVRCHRSMFWDIRNHVLITASRAGWLQFRMLKPSSASASSIRSELHLRNILQPLITRDDTGFLRGVHATMDGDVICIVERNRLTYLARITASGNVVWWTRHNWMASTITSKFVYVFDHYHTDIVLAIIDISNGHIMGSPSIHTSHISFWFEDYTMVMSADERFIVVKSKGFIVTVLDVGKGTFIKLEEAPNMPLRGGIDQLWLTPEPDSSNFRELLWRKDDCVIGSRYIYQGPNGRYARKEASATMIPHSKEGGGVPRGIDFDRRLVFEEVPNADGSSIFHVKSLSSYRTFHYGDETSHSMSGDGGDSNHNSSIITAPGLKNGQRKKVVMSKGAVHQECRGKADFFGWRDDYLVFHDIKKGRLVVLRFYPDW